MLALFAKQQDVRPFEVPGINVFTGNERDPTDTPDAALIFGGDGTLHRHLGTLALKKIPTLSVPIGSANDFATSVGIRSVADALAVWQQFVHTQTNTKLVDLGTIQPLHPFEAAEMLPPAEDDPAGEPWQGESLETLHFVPDGPRRDLPQLGPRIEHSQARRWIEAADEASRTRYFSCIAGTGLDAVISRQITRQPRWLRSHGGYVWALLQSLPRFQPRRLLYPSKSMAIGERRCANRACWSLPAMAPSTAAGCEWLIWRIWLMGCSMLALSANSASCDCCDCFLWYFAEPTSA